MARALYGSAAKRLGTKTMKLLILFSAYACALQISGSALAADGAMTAGDLQQICIGSSAESKAACRFYILGIVHGIDVGMNIPDGKTQGGRPCIPENLPGSALELAVKKRMREVLMLYPDDRKLDASGFVGGMIIDGFPCRKPTRR